MPYLYLPVNLEEIKSFMIFSVELFNRQPKPTEEDLGKTQVTKPFPAEHRYASHVGRYSLFPSYDSSVDMQKGKSAVDSQPTLPAESPTNRPPDSTVVAKTKVTPARYEIVKPPISSEGKPLEFREGPNYHQVLFISKVFTC